MDWQPIDSAPRDGSTIVAVRAGTDNPCGYSLIFYDEGWVGLNAEHHKMQIKYEPTHWLPLPPKPDH